MEYGTELNSSKEGKHLNLPSEPACTVPHKYTYMHLPSPHLLVSLCTCSLLTASSFVQPQPPYMYDIHQSLISLREELRCSASVSSKDMGKLPYARSVTQEEKWSTQLQHQGPHHQRMGALPPEVITWGSHEGLLSPTKMPLNTKSEETR